MTTLWAALGIWAIGSIVFVLAIAAAAARSTPSVGSVPAGGMETAEDIVRRLHLAPAPKRRASAAIHDIAAR